MDRISHLRTNAFLTAASALLAAQLGATEASATLVDIRPDHDNFVQSVEPATVKNHEGNLAIGNLTGEQRTFLKFDIGSVPLGSTIQSATLTIRTRNDFNVNKPVGVTGVADDTWDETTITWNNQPTASGALFFDQYVAEALGAGVSQLDAMDATTYVKDQFDVNDTLISFRLSPEQSGTGLFLRADEHSDQSEHPWAKLTVEYVPIPEPASLGLMGLGAVALLSRRRRA